MTSLYPPIEPFSIYRMAVDEPHVLYVEECGNAEGVPVVFLHGGPGSGGNPDSRRFFDPAFYRIVIIDQRGAGRSAPRGETRRNRTLDLVADMETVRLRLGIRRWLLLGGSWGAALALIYSQRHPRRVSGLILRGLFLARERDLDWFFNSVNRLFPEEWEAATDWIARTGQEDLITAFYNRIHGSDRKLSLDAARAWSDWGRSVVTWSQSSNTQRELDEEDQILDKARIESHYAKHRYFIAENEILERVGELPDVPVSIIHGRRDLTCTLEAAWTLHRALAGSRLIVVPNAGHLSSEPSIIDALVRETDRMREWFQRGAGGRLPGG